MRNLVFFVILSIVGTFYLLEYPKAPATPVVEKEWDFEWQKNRGRLWIEPVDLKGEGAFDEWRKLFPLRAKTWKEFLTENYKQRNRGLLKFVILANHGNKEALEIEGGEGVYWTMLSNMAKRCGCTFIVDSCRGDGPPYSYRGDKTLYRDKNLPGLLFVAPKGTILGDGIEAEAKDILRQQSLEGWRIIDE